MCPQIHERNENFRIKIGKTVFSKENFRQEVLKTTQFKSINCIELSFLINVEINNNFARSARTLFLT